MNPDVMRKESNYYLLLFSGLQMLCSLYYDWDLCYGSTAYKLKVGEKLFGAWKYGALSLFLNGLIYHCISKPLYRGTSGIPLNYICVLLNINQFCALICFFYPIFKYDPKNGYTIFQLFVYIPTFVSGVLLNIYGWSRKEIPSITLTGSWVLSRRRDWGLVGVYLAACQLVLIFWNSMKCFYDAGSTKTRYGNQFNVYAASLFLMVVGSLGYHVLALKVSKGKFPCHDILKYITLGFAIIEFVGLIMYCYSCTKANQTRIFYYHSLFFSAGMVVAAFGNAFISWKKFDEDVNLFESGNYYKI